MRHRTIAHAGPLLLCACLVAAATLLSVKPGQELQDIDIVLAAAPPPRK